MASPFPLQGGSLNTWGTELRNFFSPHFNLNTGDSKWWVNVKDPSYGAIGDGVTDDSTAINNALAAMPSRGGTLYFPAGRYKITSEIQYAKRGSVIRGSGTSDGNFGSMLVGTLSVPLLSLGAGGGTIYDVVVEHMGFEQSGSGTVITLGGVNSISNIYFRNCTIVNKNAGASDALLIRSVVKIHFEQCFIRTENAGNAVKITNLPLASNPTTISFYKVEFDGLNSTTGTAFLNESNSGLSIIASVFQNANIGLDASNTDEGFIANNHFENLTTGVRIGNSGSPIARDVFIGNNVNATTPWNEVTLSPTAIFIGNRNRADRFDGTVTTFASLDTSPSVAARTRLFKTNNAAPTTITTFDDGFITQEIAIIFTDAQTTVAETGNIKLSAAFVSTADDTMKLIYDGTNWFETARSVN